MPHYTNYHSHCNYCDGTSAPHVYVEEAIKQGFRAYGFSSHAPVPFATAWNMPAENLPKYFQEIQALKTKYQDLIQIYCGLEIDFVPGQVGPHSAVLQSKELDYTIGSIHFVDAFPDGQPWEIDGSRQVFDLGLAQIFKGNIRAAVTRYWELTRQMVLEECPTVIGHLDKIKMQNKTAVLFSENADWYQVEIQKTLPIIAHSGAIVEVNTRGLYKNKTREVYPGRWILEQMHSLNIPLTISSDAHHPREIALGFDAAAQLLQEIGYQETYSLLNGSWTKVPLTAVTLT